MGRKTVEDYRALAEKKGFQWLGKELPANAEIKTLWQCIKDGHQWESTYWNIRHIHNCPECAKQARRLSADDYHAAAKKKGILWLGPQVPNNRTKTWWQCKQNHRWATTIDSIKNGGGCPHCAGNAPKTVEDYKVLADECGLEWIGLELPLNTSIKTTWECKKERHRREVSYQAVRKSGSCPYCDGNVQKTAEDYHTIFGTHGVKWLGPEVPNVNTKTWWECEKGHRWATSYSCLRIGSGCPYCARVAHKIAKDYHALAAKHDLKWTGVKLPPNTHTKTSWECNNQKHHLEYSYHDIRQGNGCVKCTEMINGQRASGQQKQICDMVNGELNYPCDSYYIDIALLDEMIAIEYDSWFWHSHRLEYDEKRDKELIAAGWKILRVKSNEQLPTKKQLSNALRQLRAGKMKNEIILNDWGRGRTFAEIRG